MSTKRHLLSAGVAVALTTGLAGSTAFAASSPRALGVRINCQLPGATGANTSADCKSLSGWFEGRLEWISGGQVIFQEEGSFVGLPGVGEVHVYADAGGDEKLFHRVYESTDPMAPSILTAPDLSVRLYTKGPDGQYALVSEQRYQPEASALWAIHSEDTAQVNADIATERAARAAADKDLTSQLASEIKDRQAGEALLNGALGNEVSARKQDDAALLSSIEQQLTAYTYSKAEVDSKVASLGSGYQALQSSALASVPSIAQSLPDQVSDVAVAAPASVSQMLRDTVEVGQGLKIEGTVGGKVQIALDHDYVSGAAFDGVYIKQAAKSEETKINSHLFVDGKMRVNGPIEINRPDGSVRIGHGSSILELIGADPNIYPNAPAPTVFFSPDPQHQLLNTSATSTPNNVPTNQQVQFGLLSNQYIPTLLSGGGSYNAIQNNPMQQVPTYGANNAAITQVGVLATQNAQLQAGPHANGDTGEIRLAGTLGASLQPSYTGFKAPATPAGGLGPQGSFLYVLPPSPGANGQAMVNDGNGNLTWTNEIGDVAGPLTNNTVQRIQRQPVSSVTPQVNSSGGTTGANGQIFDYNSATNQWQPDYNMNLPGSGTIAGTLGVTGNTTIGGTLGVTGNTTIGGTLGVTGATTLSSTLGVTSNATIGGTLGVTGATTLSNTLYVGQSSTLNGATTLNSTLTVAGATTINNALTATGNGVIGGTLGVTGATTLNSNLSVTGTTTLGGATTMNSSLTVAGPSTLNNTLYVAGAATFNSSVSVAGAGSFASVTSTGDIVSTSGKIQATVGNGTFGGAGSFGSNLVVGQAVNGTQTSGNLNVIGNGSSTGNGTFSGLLTAKGAGTNYLYGALTAGGTGTFGGTLNVNGGGSLNVSGGATITGNEGILGTLSVGANPNPTSYRAYVAGDLMADGGWIYITGNQGIYFSSYNGGWYMSDSTWIRAYADKSIYTGGEIDGSTVRGTSQLCIGTDCRSQWPTDGFNCAAQGASDAYHTCATAEDLGTVGWGANNVYTDWIPGQHASEHWYKITFGGAGYEGNGPDCRCSGSSSQSGHIYLDNGYTPNSTTNYAFDIFYNCSAALVNCDEGGLYDYVGHTSFDTVQASNGSTGGQYESYNTTTYWVRVRPVDENRDCNGYALRVGNY